MFAKRPEQKHCVTPARVTTAVWVLYPLSAKRARGNGAHYLLQFLAHYSHWKEGNSPSAEGAEHAPLHGEGGTLRGLKPSGMKPGIC